MTDHLGPNLTAWQIVVRGSEDFFRTPNPKKMTGDLASARIQPLELKASL
jgi:hypothetical protein